MRYFRKTQSWPGDIILQLTPDKRIRAIHDIIWTVESNGLFIQIQALNQADLQPLTLFGADKWLVNQDWVHANLVHPGIHEIDQFTMQRMKINRSGQ